MDIIGNGVDIIKNSRINSSLKIKGFLNRIFTKKEIEQGKNLKNKINFYAKRFAAKEAFSKSLGSGFRNNLNFKDIVVKNDRYGMPFFYISKKIKFLITKKFKIKKFYFTLSIADEKTYSIAFVTFQK